MAAQQQTQTAPATTGAPCPDVQSILDEVNKELAEFESKKLPELKAELDAIVKKKQTLLDEYQKKYPALRERWCAQRQLVETLHQSLRCAFAGQDWKKIVSECICEARHDVYCLERSITQRRRCCAGRREWTRDQAKLAFDAAKARLDALNANAQKADAALSEADKLIKEIQGLVPGPDQTVALYLFWFRLLPLHNALMPEDLAADCKPIGADETPESLCADVFGKDCPDDNPCKPAEEQGEGVQEQASARRSAPWLMPWGKYGQELDCAWGDYYAAKKALASAESSFRAAPDDLASLGKKLDDWNKGLEEKIRQCLRNVKPEDTCCTAAGATSKSEEMSHA